MRLLFVFLSCFELISCAFRPTLTTSNISIDSTLIEQIATPTSEPIPYAGIAIDQVFPVIGHSEFENAEQGKKNVKVPVDDLVVSFQYFKPQSIEHDGRTIFHFLTKPGFGYWSTVVGTSHLLGSDSTEIYLNSIGPGAVCCTNYWITDISAKTPRSIFRSEDYGNFRDAMEIFDADGDGIYELVQFDSCMRYFRDDCGSCSPEPRAYFKYDPKMRKYRPAKGIVQDFVLKQLSETESWLAEKYGQYILSQDPVLSNDLHRSVIAHVSDLLHLGQDKQAWKIFRRYSKVVDEEDRKEILRRLASCKFYKALRSKV